VNLTLSVGGGHCHFQDNLCSFYLNPPIVMWTLGWDIEQTKPSFREVPEKNLHMAFQRVCGMKI